MHTVVFGSSVTSPASAGFTGDSGTVVMVTINAATDTDEVDDTVVSVTGTLESTVAV